MSIDKDLLRRKALVAAGSVVLALGLGACTVPTKADTGASGDSSPTDTGKAADSDDTGSASGDTDTGAVDTDSGPVDTDSGGAETGGKDTDTAPVDTDTASAKKPDCTIMDTGIAACCEALSEWCNDAYGADRSAVDTCIYGPDYDGSTGCIPWGPPVPPAFRQV